LSSKRNEYEGARERERERKKQKKVLQRMNRDREKEGAREREREDKETIKKKVVVVDTFFILHLHTIYKSLYFSPFPSFFFLLCSTLEEKVKKEIIMNTK